MQTPAAVQLTVPFAATGAGVVTLRACPSGSLSFARTFTLPAVSSFVVNVSLFATGERLKETVVVTESELSTRLASFSALRIWTELV